MFTTGATNKLPRWILFIWSSIYRDSDCNKFACQTTRWAYKHPFWSCASDCVLLCTPVYTKWIAMQQFENRSNLFIPYLIENSLLNSLNHIYQAVCLWLIVLLNILKYWKAFELKLTIFNFIKLVSKEILWSFLHIFQGFQIFARFKMLFRPITHSNNHKTHKLPLSGHFRCMPGVILEGFELQWWLSWCYFNLLWFWWH